MTKHNIDANMSDMSDQLATAGQCWNCH